MIELTHEWTPVPDLEVVPPGAAFADGSVYVVDGSEGNVAQVVASRQKVVLEVGGRCLELTTSDYSGEVGGAGTYVKASVAGDDVGKAGTIRLYGWRDFWRKLRSRAGVLVWLPTVVGVLLAVSGIVFISATSPTDRASVAETAKDLQRWIVSPPASAPSAPATRVLIASRCLDGLAGRKVPTDVQIPGIECKPASPSFFEDKDHAALISLIGGVLTALVAVIAAFKKLTFGKAP